MDLSAADIMLTRLWIAWIQVFCLVGMKLAIYICVEVHT